MLDQRNFSSLFLFDLGLLAFSKSNKQGLLTLTSQRFFSTASFVEDSGLLFLEFWKFDLECFYSPNSTQTRPLTTSLSSGYFRNKLIASNIPTKTPSRKQQIVA
jgi:hypothetical protein